MRSLPIALIACFAALAVGSSCILDRTAGFEPEGTGAGGPGGGGTGGVIMTGCELPSDCGGTTDCTTEVDCINGRCQFTYAPPGRPCTGTLPEQQYCNGMGTCVQCALAEHCEAGTCSGGVQADGETCVAGVCTQVDDPVPCGDYTCNDSGTNCQTSCLDSGDCSDPTHVCEPSDGLCGPPRQNGDPCSVNEVCQSGFCADGVCCDSDCATQCQACRNVLTGVADGTCDNIVIGVDDQDAPCPDGFGCQGDGTCTTCGQSTIDPAGGGCPNICDSCTNGNTVCQFSCTDSSPCNALINCPPGKDCDVDCAGTSACVGMVVACPAGRQCTVTCSNDDSSCQNVTMNCSADGPCKIDCKNGNNGNCSGATINCGTNECDVHCSTSGEPAFTDLQMSCDLKTDAECP